MQTRTRQCIMPDDYLPYIPDDILFEDDESVLDDDIVMDLDDDDVPFDGAGLDADTGDGENVQDGEDDEDDE